MKVPEETFEDARVLAAGLIGFDPGDTVALLDAAASCVGERRAAALEVTVAGVSLTARHRAVGSVAAVVVGARQLGAAWWDAHPPSSSRRASTADELLATGAAGTPLERLSALEDRVSDAAADAVWGEPAGMVDLNVPMDVVRVPAPGGAAPGDRVVMSFDPGGRVDAVIEERPGGAAAIVDLDSCRHSAPVRAAWAAALTTLHRHVTVPAEAGDDPWQRPVDLAVLEALHDYAAAHEAIVGVLAGPVAGQQVRAGDVFDALVGGGWPWSSLGAHRWWWQAVAALVDGETLGATSTRPA